MKDVPLHPNHLRPGDKVGSWRIVKVLGRGGYGRVFKVERNGHFYTLKMSLLPLSSEPTEEEEDPRLRMGREVAAMMASTPHPQLLRVHAVDCWPHPDKGYPYFVTDSIEADDWHGWRWKHNPHAGEVVDKLSGVVDAVGELHRRGIFHRELKGEHVLIRREDGRPFLIDFGSVRMPGARTVTQGLPPGVIHLLTPEAIDFVSRREDEPGARYEGGVAGDLYALGILLYQALTDCYPFDARLSDQELVASILLEVPTAPHVLNPRAPRSLSDIAMRLLEKRPEDRYADTAALRRALAEAAEKERESDAWKVPLLSPEQVATAAAREEARSRSAAEARSREEARAQEEARAGAPSLPPVWRRRLAMLAGLVAGLALAGLFALCSLALWATLTAPRLAAPVASVSHQKGSPSMPSLQDTTLAPHASWWKLLLTGVCTAHGLGCSSAPVMPSPSEPCPQEARYAMARLGLTGYDAHLVTIDIHQPGEPYGERGVYRTGPIIGRVESDPDGEKAWTPGTLLYGYIWTEGLRNEYGRDIAVIRYTEALLPNGQRLPVCLAAGTIEQGHWLKEGGSKPGAARLQRQIPMGVVKKWRY